MSSSISTCPSRHALQIHVLLIRYHSHPVESELPEPLAKVCGHLVDLEVSLPVVIPHLELGEDLPVRLSLLVLPQHLARPHHPLVRVLVHGELWEEEHFMILLTVVVAMYQLMLNANDRLDFIEEVYSYRIRQSLDVAQNSVSLAHLPALVHRVDAGRLELLELVASLVAGAQRHLALGTEADGERSI